MSPFDLKTSKRELIDFVNNSEANVVTRPSSGRRDAHGGPLECNPSYITGPTNGVSVRYQRTARVDGCALNILKIKAVMAPFPNVSVHVK